MSTRGSVLVVDDAPTIAEVVSRYLARAGYETRMAGDGPHAIQLAGERRPDLVVLDLMLPGLDGLEVMRRIRDLGETGPRERVAVILLTAKGEESDRVIGLRLGADDYVVKPFSPKELVARVRAVLRRARPGEAARPLVAGGVSLDAARHQVTVAGQPVELTPKEFDLLHALLEASGRVLSREHLLNRVWGYAHADEIESRTVDVHIRRLRAKLGAEERRIATIKGVGYRFETE